MKGRLKKGEGTFAAATVAWYSLKPLKGFTLPTVKGERGSAKPTMGFADT
jgi:hypothetical protein